MKRIFNFIKSMTFAVVILLVLGLSSILGTIIPQGEAVEFYINKYGESKANLIQTLSLNQVFTSYWYLTLLALLSLSLLLCVIFRIKPLIYSFRNKKYYTFVDKLASWFLHLGMLLIIIFFSLGNILAFETSFYNIEDSVTPVEGTNILVAIDKFDIEVDDGGNIQNYVTKARFFDGAGKLLDTSTIRVNHPAVVNGYQFSQASFGYVLEATVSRNDKVIGTADLYQNEVVSADQGKFYIELINFFPDFFEKEEGVGTKSQEINNPVAYVNIYYMEKLIDTAFVKLGEPIEIGEYKTVLNTPKYYTLLAVRKDPFIPGALVGTSFLLLGLFTMFLLPKDKIKKENTLNV